VVTLDIAVAPLHHRQQWCLGRIHLGAADTGYSARRLEWAVAKANARRFAANVRPIIEEIMRAGATSHNAVAAKLNERHVRTERGGKWTHMQVGAILHPFVASAGA
jgi:hypothetical protein